jgi:hypothetical protein
MKYVKALGLAIVATMALTAFLGASSASATVLCTATETPCSAANKYTTTQDSEIEASLETGTTLVTRTTSGSIEDTCNNSRVKGNITAAGGATATVVVKVTELTFVGCTNTTTVNNEAACQLEIHSIANTDNGTLTGSGCTVTTVLFGVSCKYGLGNGTHLGVVTGGAMGTIDINAVVQRIDSSSILCPETTLWEGEYTITNPAGALYVESE